MRQAGRAAIWTAVGMAAAAIVGGVAVPAFGAWRDAPSASSLPGTGLVERTVCAGDETITSPTTLTVDAADATQVVAVVVPRVAMLRLDAEGRVEAAATNTGCAPRLGDEVYVVLDDGTLRADRGRRVDTVAWVGDFTAPGVFQQQSGRGATPD